MHLSLRRRDSKKPATPPAPNATASGTPEASGTPTSTPTPAQTSAPAQNGQTPEFLSSPPPTTPPHAHGLKGLGRRMTSSKPGRFIKNIASRTSLRGGNICLRDTGVGARRLCAICSLKRPFSHLFFVHSTSFDRSTLPLVYSNDYHISSQSALMVLLSSFALIPPFHPMPIHGSELL